MEMYLSRCVKDKIKTLEIELDEERSSVELLNDRVSRSRDQVAYEYTVHSRRKHLDIVINVVRRRPVPTTLSPPSFIRWTSFVQNSCRSVQRDTTWKWIRAHRRDRYHSCSKRMIHTNSCTFTRARAASLAMGDHVCYLVTAEGAEVSYSRHGGTDSTLGWTGSAGKQGSGAGGEATQRRKVARQKDLPNWKLKKGQK